jgi:quercetin dioxygenase-like cupin family protein
MAQNTSANQTFNAEEKAALSDLIAYQTGSVVSRTLVQRGAGTVTLFAFDGGQGLSEHTAPFDTLVNVIDGKATVIIAGKEHHLSAGDAILMPAGKPHALRCGEPFKMLLVMIKEKVQ